MTAGESAARWGQDAQKAARKGLWRRLTAAAGMNPAAARADALAVRTTIGAQGEQQTAALLRPLGAYGWCVLHDRRLPGRRYNLDHVLVSPCGRAVVVLDTKRWHAGMPTTLVGGRVHCGTQDRHGQVEAVARYAADVHRALGMGGVAVWPLLVVHGSRIEGGWLEARAPAWPGPVHVLGPGWLVPTLVSAPKKVDVRRAKALAGRVTRVLPSAGG